MYAFFSFMVCHRILNVVPGLHYSILLFIPHWGWTCFPSHTGFLALPSCPCLHQIFVLFEWSWPPVYNSFQLWVGERMPLATSTDHGHNLQTVQLLIKKNQVSVSARASSMLGGREGGVRRTDRFSLAPEPDTKQPEGGARKTGRFSLAPEPGTSSVLLWLSEPWVCVSQSHRPSRRRSRGTSLASTTSLRGARTSSPTAASMLRPSGRDWPTWSSCGASSSRRLRSGTGGWRRRTGPSSTTSMQLRPRPGWASRSCTWCPRRRPRWGWRLSPPPTPSLHPGSLWLRPEACAAGGGFLVQRLIVALFTGAAWCT